MDCLPTDIIEHFDVDISGMQLDQTLFVRDLKLGDKYTLVTGKDVAVATVAAPEEEAAATPAEGAAAAATPEVITKGKKEEEGAAAPAAAKAPAKK